MKKLISLFTLSFCFLFLAMNAGAQVTTNSGSGLAPTYLSLSDAIDALNLATITSPVVITLTGNETAPSGKGYYITATGTLANTIIIEGVTSTITAGANAANGNMDAIFKIVGGDYITIQNFSMIENTTANTVSTTGATNTMTEAGVLIIHSSATDGAQNNTIQNNTINLLNTTANPVYANTVGILSTSSSTTSNASPGANTSTDATSTAGTNSNNKIYGNTISNVQFGIMFVCPPVTATVFETGNDIGGSSASTGNSITYGVNNATSNPWNRASGTSSGMQLRNAAGNSIRFNTVNTIPTLTVASIAINISSGTAPTGVTYTSTISDNTITMTNTGTTAITGIDFGHGIATGTIAGSNNNVTINQTSTAANSAAVICIKANYTSATNTCNSNTILLNQSQTTGALSTTTTGLTLAGTSTTISANSNSITINQTGSGTGTITGAITALSVAGTSTTNNVLTNTILINQTTSVVSGISTAITGVVATSAASGSLNITTTNNITIKQAVTGAGTWGAGAIAYLSINAAHGNVNVTGNSFNTTGSVIRSTGALDCILGGSSTLTGLLTIKNNTASIDRVSTTGNVGFYTQTSTSPNDPSDSISLNNITLSSLATSGTVTVINRIGGSTTAVRNICNNTISVSGTNTGSVTGIANGYSNPSRVLGNSITATCSAPTVIGISGITGNPANCTIAQNTISLTSSSASPTSIIGINGTSTGPYQIINNTFSALNFTGVITGSPVISGIALSVGTGNNVKNNIINNITVGAATSTANAIVDGILISGGATTNVFKNKIYGIVSNCTGVTGIVNGIRISGGATVGDTIYNNLIGNLSAPASTNPDGVRGISITSSTSASFINVFYNTVYLSGSGGTNFGSTGIFHTASTTATTAALNLRNNIVVNNTTPNGTGVAVAYRRSSGTANTLNNYVSTSNNNLFFSGVLGGSANPLIYSDGVSAALTLAAYKSGVFTAGTIAPRDNLSVTENPNFLSTTGSSANFLHIDSTIATLIESGATTVVTPLITDDYDGIARYPNSGYPNNLSFPASAPDIGADEFGGITIDMVGPVITYTALGNNSNLVSRNLTAAITDFSGVDVGANLPRLYYKKSTDGAYVIDNAPVVSAPNYTWTINYSLVGGGSVAPGDIIQYYVAAQDINGYVTTNPAGGSGSNPPGTTPPGSPNSYTIVGAPLAGDYTVGTTLFNRITGKNITFERVVKKVMIEVTENETVTENIKTESGNLESDAISNALVKDETSKVIEKKVMKEVEEESWIPMENGKVYDGPTYIKRIDDPNLPDEAMAGIYLNITAAVADLNLRGASAAVRFLLIDINYVEAGYPIVISPWVGNSAVNTLTFQPNTGVTTVITGSSATAIFDISGADYVIFNGSNNSSNTKDMTIRNTNTAGPAIRFINDATSDTVKNCIMESGNTSTTSGTILFSTSTGTLGNSSDVIENCDIRDRSDAAGVPANGVYSSGSAGAPNGSNKISGCNVFNWTNAGVLVTSTGAGNGWTINPSSFYQTAARTTSLIVISIQGGSGHSILSNNIGGSASNRSGSPMSTTGTFSAISLNVGTLSATSVQGNTISNINISGGSTQTSQGINVTGGNVNIGTITGNTIGGGASPYDTIRCNYDTRMIYNTGSGILNIENNTIGNVAYYNNTNDELRGIRSSAGVNTIRNNIVRDLKSNASASTSFFLSGIDLLAATAGNIIEGNQIYNLSQTNTTGGAVFNVGMFLSSFTSADIRKNKISGIDNANAAGLLYGIYALSGNGNYSNNTITVSPASLLLNPFIGGLRDDGTSGSNNWYYNSVSISGTSGAGANNTFAFFRSGTTTVSIRNNAFANSRSGGGFNIAFGNTNAAATGWSSTSSNYNAVYNSTSTPLVWLGAVMSLSAFQAASGGDLYTYNGNPGFTSATDVTPDATNSNCWILNGNGIALSGFGTDINGNTRSTTIAGGGTDIGAYEFTPAVNPPVISVTPSVSPLAISNFILGEETVASIYVTTLGGLSNVDLQYYSGTVPPGLPGSPPVTDGYGNVYWDIQPTGTGFTYNLTIHYSPALLGTTVESAIKVAIQDPPNNPDGFYTPYPQGTGDGQSNVDFVNHNITVTGLTTMGKFIITDANSALPIELASFVSSVSGRNVDLKWATSEETNNSGFDIERSSVNGSWSKIGNVTGNGTTSSGHSYSYTDRNVASGNYNYRLKQIDFNGHFEYFNLTGEVNVGIPTKFELSQNYPNPFNPSTKINFDLPTDGKVSLKIFDMSGKEIMTLVNEVKTAGYYSVSFNASSLSSGVYFYRLTADNFTSTKKMMLVK